MSAYPYDVRPATLQQRVSLARLKARLWLSEHRWAVFWALVALMLGAWL